MADASKPGENKPGADEPAPPKSGGRTPDLLVRFVSAVAMSGIAIIALYLGGWVWIVMFGFVMSLSLAANLVLTLGVASNRRTRSEPVYLLLLTMFLVNVADYSLLSFEFSLGVEHVFPYSEPACAAYQASAYTVYPLSL